MLTLDEFNEMSEKEQCEYVKEYCTFLMYRMEGVVIAIHLYFAGDFYIEIWHNMEMNEVEFVRTFKHSKCLDPYLKDINLKPSQ